MGTTADKLNRLLEIKANIKQAIRDKGVYIGDYDAFAEYPDAIRRIETSSGEGGSDEFFNMRTQNGTNFSNLFYCYTGSELDLSGWDTSNVTNMYEMFIGCQNLISLDLSSFNTSNVTNMNRMFADCENLTSLDLSNFDTSKVTNMEDMFSGCRNLISLDIRNFDMEYVVNNIHIMFSWCDNLRELRLDNCNHATIEKIINSWDFPTGDIDGETRKMYVNPDNITDLIAPEGWIFVDSDGNEIVPEPEEPEIYVPGYYQGNTEITEATTMVNSSHDNLSEMFAGCENLTTINNIEQWDTSNVTNMWSMFANCRNLERLDLSNFDMSKVDTSAEPLLMFLGCDNLRELRLDNCSNDTINKIINNDAGLPFGDIDGETRKIYVKEANVDGLMPPYGWEFVFVDSDDNEISGGEIPVCEFCGEEGCDGSCRYCPECGELNENCTCEPEEVTAYVIATFNTTEPVQIMGEPSYDWLSSYDEGNTWERESNTTRGNEIVYLRPNNVNDVKIYRLFEGCSYLTNATFIGFSNASINPYSDNMFNGCVSLESLDLNSLNLDGFNVDMMFNNCDNLRELHLEDCNYETIEKIINEANLPTGEVDGETRKMHVNPDNIEGLTAPEGWIFVDSDGNEIGGEQEPEKPGLTVYQEGEYRENAEITEVYTLVTKEHTDLGYMFLNCRNLQTINGIEQWDTSNVISMWSMFEGCFNLRYLDLRSFDMSNVSNTSGMFLHCNELKVLRLDNWDYEIIRRIINEAGLPTGDIGGRSRLMYVQEANIINPDNQDERLTAPDGWKFVYVAGNPQDTYDSDSRPFKYDGIIQEVNVAVTKEHDNLSEMFRSCENLEVIHNIDTWDTSNVTDMSSMFNNCSKLTSLDLSSWYTGNVTNMCGMFFGCVNLIYLDIRNFNISDSTEIGDMFVSCDKLQVLRLDNCVNSVIERIINDANLPTGDIDGRLRKMYILEKYATNPEENGLTVPNGWEFEYVEAKKE